MNRVYSLTDYILSVKIPADLFNTLGLTNSAMSGIDSRNYTISIGGEQSYIGNITINATTAQWSTEGDVTGSWVHNKSLNQTGTVTVQINQVSDKVRLLAKIYQIYFAKTYTNGDDAEEQGLHLTVSKARANGSPAKIADCYDCYLSNRAELTYGSTAAEQNWPFTCGRITIDGEAL